MNTFDENLLPFNCTNETNENRSNKSIEAPLYKGKIFNTWQEAFDTIESWAKKQGFNLQRLLGQKFQEFLSKFYIVRNMLHKPFFELKWQDLINLYPEAKNYLNTLYNTKEAWAHPWTCQQFTAGLHASSPVESINAWIKGYIFNSNISLCELGDIIDKRQSSEDKNHQLILWKAAIPCTFTQISTAAFMFTSINKKLEEYLPPAILKLQKNEIHQSVFYDAYQINQETINEFEEVCMFYYM
ncbi:hypothetical protein Glove_772g18 [Diversispora epigaea]|uniref:Uncharacterized protein n=1 Tax=Diversispora epigaea TaxID=1348612 RepID=A0A397G3W5_9GLOM|nr:hypothetical protein Glove_772g18 [Diversispora epigaea]